MYDLEERFFGNIGNKIKRVVWITFVLTLVLYIIAGLVCETWGFILLFNEYTIGMGFLIMLLTPVGVIVGIFSTWLSLLTLYGLGHLITNTDKLVGSKTGDAEENTKSQPTYDSTPIVKTHEPTEDGWICTKCGKANHASRATCRHCDAPKVVKQKPQNVAPIVRENAPLADGWTCSKCGKANHPSRTTCRHCGAEK